MIIHKTDYSIKEAFELKTKQGSSIKRYKEVGKKMGILEGVLKDF